VIDKEGNHLNRLGRRLMAYAAFAILIPTAAGAQLLESVVAGARVKSVPLFSAAPARRSTGIKTSDSGRAVHMANGALIGAGIGVALGLIASPILNAQNSDHTEDGMTYVVLPAFGAFFGLIIGGIVGWSRGP
jgi:hypothetical protein